MKKPPYKSYRKEDKKKEVPVHIPEKIDTPEAEQLVEDIYRLKNLLYSHWKKLSAIAAVVFVVGASVLGYHYYRNSLELKAARIVDEALWDLEHGNKEEALKLFNKAVSEFPSAPSSKLAAFMIDKLTGSNEHLENLSKEKSFLFSSPSTTSLATRLINKGELKKAENLLSKVKRNSHWTHPEAVYDEMLVGLKSGDSEKARNALETLQGDYAGLPITDLARSLME